jgi:hypothetical protein
MYAYCNISNGASSGASFEPSLFGVHIHKGYDASRGPAHHRLVASAQIEIFVTVVSIRISMLMLRN